MKPKLITCNYTSLYGSRMNGRLNRDQIYMYSLRGIAECGETIINYTCPYNQEFVNPYMEAQGITNIISINYDLEKDHPWHTRIDAIKDIHPRYYTETSWLNRCCEIMTLKFLVLEEHFKNLEEFETLYWIDCGISHGGIISRKFNTFEGKKEYYRENKPDEMQLEYAHRHDKIFNKDFIPRLDKFADGKILCITANHNQHGDQMGFDYVNHLHQWPIGGIFGGQKQAMLPFINRFKELYMKVMDANLLVKEEQIMAVILNEHPEWFSTYTFETWYHPDWNVYNPKLISFSSFFDELLKITI